MKRYAAIGAPARTAQHPKPYTVRRHYNRRMGVTTYTVQIQGVRDHAGLPEFYDADEARRFAEQRNRIEGRHTNSP